MDSFVFTYPTAVYFGKGAAAAHLPQILAGYGPNVLLAYGGGSIRKNGVYQEITALLRDAGKVVTEFSGIMPNPTYEKVQEGARLARDAKADLILAVGGGSVVDCCKIVAAQVLSGAFDTLSHAMETYFGQSDRDNVSDEVAIAIMRSTVANMRTLLTDLRDETARSNLMWTSAMAENGILKVGRKTDFEVHQMEHQLGAYTDCNHGQGLVVLHPAYYRSQLPEATEKLARLARELWEIPVRGQSDPELANEAIDALSSFIRECGLPTRLSQLRTRTPITKSLLAQVADSCNRLATGCRQLTRDEIYELFCQCL